jgi:hypothetical protein
MFQLSRFVPILGKSFGAFWIVFIINERGFVPFELLMAIQMPRSGQFNNVENDLGQADFIAVMYA